MTTETESKLQQRVDDLEGRIGALEARLGSTIGLMTATLASLQANSANRQTSKALAATEGSTEPMTATTGPNDILPPNVTREMANEGCAVMFDLVGNGSTYAAEEVYRAMQAVRHAELPAIG